VKFVLPRNRRERSEAKRALLEFEIPAHARPGRSPRPPEQTHPADERFARELAKQHASLNADRFGGKLTTVPIRVSRRMKTRLGHYAWRGSENKGAEIVISRRHIRKNGWDEALHTLLHEMVHQWQDEAGLPIDHGREFRKKARTVGIVPRAKRTVA
jgi:hypothetical protein